MKFSTRYTAIKQSISPQHTKGRGSGRGLDAINSVRLRISRLRETSPIAVTQYGDQESPFSYEGTLGLLNQHADNEVNKNMLLL